MTAFLGPKYYIINGIFGALEPYYLSPWTLKVSEVVSRGVRGCLLLSLKGVWRLCAHGSAVHL